MMLASVMLLFLAVFLDGIIRMSFAFLSSNFTVLTLLMIYPLFLKKKKFYLLLLLLSTFFYDTLYTNILFFHPICLFCIYFLLEKNQKNFDLFSIIGYFLLYQVILFSLFYIVGYIQNPFLLLKALLAGLIPNCFFLFLVSVFLNRWIYKKKSNGFHI